MVNKDIRRTNMKFREFLKENEKSLHYTTYKTTKKDIELAHDFLEDVIVEDESIKIKKEDFLPGGEFSKYDIQKLLFGLSEIQQKNIQSGLPKTPEDEDDIRNVEQVSGILMKINNELGNNNPFEP
jgi:hypothetical protein